MTTPTEVTTPTDHRPEVVTVIAHMRAKPGKEQDLRDALEARGSPGRRPGDHRSRTGVGGPVALTEKIVRG